MYTRDYSIEGQYPGERPGKDIDRLFTYASFIKAVGLKEFRRGHHLILLGPGGDLELLKQLGVPPMQIVGVDKERAVCERFKSHPHVLHMKVEDIKDTPKEFTTINLDFCENLSPKLLRITTSVLNTLLTPKTVFSVNFQASRELPWNVSIQDALSFAKARVGLLKNKELASDVKLPRAVALMDLLKKTCTVRVQELRYFCYVARGLSLRGKPVNSTMSRLIGGGREVQNVWTESKKFSSRACLDEREVRDVLCDAGIPAKQLDSIFRHKNHGGTASMRKGLEAHTKFDGESLRKRRESLGLSRVQLESLAGVSSKTIETLECNRQDARGITMWAKLMSALERKEGKTTAPLAKTSAPAPQTNGHTNGVSKTTHIRVVVADAAMKIAQMGSLSKQEKEIILRAVG